MPTATFEPLIESATGVSASSPDTPVIQTTAKLEAFSSVEDMTLDSKMASETMSEALPAKRPVVRVPKLRRARTNNSDRFQLLQKWEGVVLEADGETFTARLHDSLGELESHQATFSRAELSKEEQPLIEVGAPFVWTIGYNYVRGTLHRDSTLYFRRLPPWSESEIQVADTKIGNLEAPFLTESIGWD